MTAHTLTHSGMVRDKSRKKSLCAKWTQQNTKNNIDISENIKLKKYFKRATTIKKEKNHS